MAVLFQKIETCPGCPRPPVDRSSGPSDTRSSSQRDACSIQSAMRSAYATRYQFSDALRYAMRFRRASRPAFHVIAASRAVAPPRTLRLRRFDTASPSCSAFFLISIRAFFATARDGFRYERRRCRRHHFLRVATFLRWRLCRCARADHASTYTFTLVVVQYEKTSLSGSDIAP